ncbi:transglycosylase SLT domain-containing protein, partial [Acinetobacter baumannii]
VAVIDTESSFRPNARGSHGEIGLMQLKPSTAQWIARRHGLPWWGPATLLDPAAIVRLGAAYLSDIRNRLELARARETNPEHQLHKL